MKSARFTVAALLLVACTGNAPSPAASTDSAPAGETAADSSSDSTDSDAASLDAAEAPPARATCLATVSTSARVELTTLAVTPAGAIRTRGTLDVGPSQGGLDPTFVAICGAHAFIYLPTSAAIVHASLDDQGAPSDPITVLTAPKVLGMVCDETSKRLFVAVAPKNHLAVEVSSYDYAYDGRLSAALGFAAVTETLSVSSGGVGRTSLLRHRGTGELWLLAEFVDSFERKPHAARIAVDSSGALSLAENATDSPDLGFEGTTLIRRDGSELIESYGCLAVTPLPASGALPNRADTVTTCDLGDPLVST